MASRPNVSPLKQADFSRRILDIPGTRPADSTSVGEKTLTVGREITLSGQISECDHLIVEGNVQANLDRATSLSISAGGEFRGTVDVQEAHIHGLFEGDLTAHRKVSISSTGRLIGSLKTAALSVEEGAYLKGALDPIEPPPKS